MRISELNVGDFFNHNGLRFVKQNETTGLVVSVSDRYDIGVKMYFQPHDEVEVEPTIEELMADASFCFGGLALAIAPNNINGIRYLDAVDALASGNYHGDRQPDGLCHGVMARDTNLRSLLETVIKNCDPH